MIEIQTIKCENRTVVNMIPFYDVSDFEEYETEFNCGLTNVIRYFKEFGLNKAYCRIILGKPFKFETTITSRIKMDLIDIIKLTQEQFSRIDLEEIELFSEIELGEPLVDLVSLTPDSILIAIGNPGICVIELQFAPD
ncbi:hypothetical protein [Salipaludibacillus sp. CF4.18]|uniref:hypothetical protein n=1 Tax=Salipaludibacillus sp. CF4.18 TaxID=3373081 RepID=UPI003EE81107